MEDDSSCSDAELKMVIVVNEGKLLWCVYNRANLVGVGRYGICT